MKEEQSNVNRYMQAAKELELFVSGQAASDVFWRENGSKLYDKLKHYIWSWHKKYNYGKVKSPIAVSSSLFTRSGHANKYKDNIFSISDTLALRPMSCPNHIVLYEARVNSYQNLPVKLFEFGDVFRQESSGSLQVLLRQRQFCQDDAHLFARENQLPDLISQYLELSSLVYRELGFEHIKYCVSLRPENRFGEDAQWDRAEEILLKCCRQRNIEPIIQPGEGAFYGPKIELQVVDQRGRWWQLGVIQLDYVLAQRFNLYYINEAGEKEVPVILHHAVLGSLERMIAVLLESFGVHLPEFLHPIDCVIIPINAQQSEYCHIVKSSYDAKNPLYRDALVDRSSESLSKKIQKWVSLGVPNIFVVGKKEEEKYREDKSIVVSKRLKNGQSVAFEI